ncbi:hypothetical protein SALBM311S_12592 [Streptomyces alboniger]
MPSHLSADRPAAQPPGRGSVDALISQTRRLKGDVDAVRRDTRPDGPGPQDRWQRALYDLALHQLNDVDEHLAQLRDGPPPVPAASTSPEPEPAVRAAPPTPRRGSLLSRVGSAEWNLLTDEASWSSELYQILGRDPAAPPLTLDELPSLVWDADRPRLTTMVTDCLVDARPIDGEFRIVRPGGDIRTVHMMGEPVLDPDGSTASMWAVLRDVSELRRSQRAVSETRDSLQRHRHHAQTEHRLAVELQEAVLPPWRGSLRLPHQGPETLDLAAHYLPSTTSALIGGDWYDALELADGETLLSVGQSYMALLSAGPAASAAPAPAVRVVEHEVHSREFGEDRSSRSARPRHPSGCSSFPSPCRFPARPCRARPRSSMVTTRPRRSVNRTATPRHGIARDLSRVDPPPHP